MLRETRVFECDCSDDLVDALTFARGRTDGGRTEIRLDKSCTYSGIDPMIFTGVERVTLDMAGLAFMPNGDGWKIATPNAT